MRSVHALAGALALVAVGCAGAPSPGPKAARPAAELASSEQASVMQMVLPDAISAVYFARKSAGEAGAKQPKALDGYFDELPKEIKSCGLDIDSTIEVMASQVEDETTAIAARLEAPAAKLVACVADKGFPRRRVEGRASVKVKGFRIIDMGSVALVGDAADLDVLSLDAAPPRWFELVADVDGTLVGEWSPQQSRSVRHSGQALIATIREGSAEDADFMANVFRASIDDAGSAVAAGLKSKQRKGVERWLHKAHVRRAPYYGVEIAVPVDAEPPGHRIRTFEKFADELSERVVRKQAEAQARLDLIGIAVSLSLYAKEHKTGLSRLPSFPASAPLTPSEVPSAEPIFASYNEWQHATWRSLEFSCEGPCFYSYQLEVSSDRRHAIARAVADHDGDGELTMLAVSLDIDGSGQIDISEIEVDNPLD